MRVGPARSNSARTVCAGFASDGGSPAPEEPGLAFCLARLAANIPGGPFIRKDVTPIEPELVILSDKLFPGHPDTFEFAPLQGQYSPIMIKYLKERGLM